MMQGNPYRGGYNSSQSTNSNNNNNTNQQSSMNLAQVNPNAPKLTDSIQEISWLPIPNNYLFACATWEGAIRFYNFIIGSSGGNYGVDFSFAVNVQEPAICLDFRPDGQKVYTGLANGSILEVDLQSKQTRVVGQHDQGVRNVFWHHPTNTLLSVGFDKNIRFWDVNQNSNRPQFEHKTDNIPMVSALRKNQFLYADNEQKIYETDWDKLRNSYSQTNRNLFKQSLSALGASSQITAIELNDEYIAIGSVDGRLNLHEISRVDPSASKHIITFKGHKSEESSGTYSSQKKVIMYPLSSIQTNPRAPQNWLMTSGSNGEIHLWDFKEKNKIKSLQFPSPITTAKVSPDGNVLAFGMGNDWHRGLEHLAKYTPQVGCYVIPNNELSYQKS